MIAPLSAYVTQPPALPPLPTIQQRTQQDILAPLTPPQFVPQRPAPMAPRAPAQPQVQPQANPYTPISTGLNQSMARTAGLQGSQPHVGVQFLVGSAVANHIASARGVRGDLSGGGGTYTGPGLRAGGNRLLALAKTQLGVPYVFGDMDPAGGGSAAFDCSGLTAWAFGRLGIQLPHSAAAQSQMFPRVSRDQLRPGDLVFYDYGRLGGASDHVAIYIGNGQQIAASSSASEVTVQPVDWSHFIWGGATPLGGGGGGGGGGTGVPPPRRQRPSRRRTPQQV